MAAPCIRSACRTIGVIADRSTGDVVNDLLAISEEPNVRIMETKALVCNVIPGRRPRRAVESLAESVTRTRKPHDRYGISYRLHSVHRLQSLRGCLQGMERRRRGRSRLERIFLRQHRRVGASTWRHVKFVEQAPTAGHGRQCRRAGFLDLLLRRLQALRERPAVWKLVPPDPSCGRSSAAFSSSLMSATAADTAWLRVLSVLSNAIRRTVAPSNAPSAMTVRRLD